MDSILVVGPRELPASGTVLVWMDSGNGSCDPDDRPPVVIAFEARPDGSTQVEHEGGVYYVGGSADDLWPFTTATIEATERAAEAGRFDLIDETPDSGF